MERSAGIGAINSNCNCRQQAFVLLTAGAMACASSAAVLHCVMGVLCTDDTPDPATDGVLQNTTVF